MSGPQSGIIIRWGKWKGGGGTATAERAGERLLCKMGGGGGEKRGENKREREWLIHISLCGFAALWRIPMGHSSHVRKQLLALPRLSFFFLLLLLLLYTRARDTFSLSLQFQAFFFFCF